jgi:CheY-like chemotaxis protein
MLDVAAAFLQGERGMTRIAALAGRRVLVVEDEMMIAMMIEDILAVQGCTIVGPATSVGKAMTMARAEQFDAALLDVNLKGELVYPAADLLIARGVPFIFLTGYDSAGVDKERFAAIPVLQKPCRPADLARLLAEAIEGPPPSE